MKTTLLLHDKVKITVYSTTDTLDALNILSLMLGERCTRKLVENADIIDTVPNNHSINK